MFKRTPKNEQPRPSRALAIRTPVPEVAEGNPPEQDGSGPPALRDEFEVVISEGSSFDGIYRTEESICIHGSVQGEMSSTGSIFVAAQARVTANVIGRTVTVAGRVDGQIVCTGRVELTPSARVTGDITAGTLIVQEGAVFDGQLKMPSRGGETSAVTVTTRE
jgi:cytoskeletal protein CcmA (bactofilin family)